MTLPSSGADAREPAPLVHAPKQARSQLTLERLLDAAEATLAELGAEGTTVPAIARRAGLSVGVVYRRFRDKDALLQAVYLRFFERSLARNADALDPARWAGAPAQRVIAAVIAGMVRGHAHYRELLRALFAYAESDADPSFRAHVERLNASATAQVTALLLARRAELDHPEPERAVELALLVIAATLHRWVRGGIAEAFPYRDDAELTRELTRVAVRYLGLRDDGDDA